MSRTCQSFRSAVVVDEPSSRFWRASGRQQGIVTGADAAAVTPAAGATTCVGATAGVQVILVGECGHATLGVLAHDALVVFDRRARVKRSLGLEDTVGILAGGTAARVGDHRLDGFADMGRGGSHGLVLLAGGTP